MTVKKPKKILASYKCKNCGGFTANGICKKCWIDLLKLEQKAYGISSRRKQ